MYRCIFFFFKQKTAYEMRISDWSSDVCSSDLIGGRRRSGAVDPGPRPVARRGGGHRRFAVRRAGAWRGAATGRWRVDLTGSFLLQRSSPHSRAPARSTDRPRDATHPCPPPSPPLSPFSCPPPPPHPPPPAP